MNWFEKIIAFMKTEMDDPTLFGWFHLMWIAIIIVGIVVVCLKCRNLSDKQFRIFLLVTGLILIILEVFKQLNHAYNAQTDTWEYAWKQFPFQFCSTPMYAMIIVSCLKECKFRNCLCSFLATFGLFAGLVVVLYPDTVLSEIIFRTSQSLFHHGAILLVGVLMFVSGKVKIEHKTIVKAIPVFAVLVGLAFIMNIIYHATGNPDSFNMFYIGPHSESDLPVFHEIGEALNIASDKINFGNFVFLFLYILAFSIAAYVVLLVAMLIKKIFVNTKSKNTQVENNNTQTNELNNIQNQNK